jgi:signal peptidase I
MRAILTAPDNVGCQLVSDILRSFGRANVRVTGSSMLPCILPGDVLTVQRQELNEVVPGDIVLFSRSNRLVAHRVVRRISGSDACLVTCGDSLDENDPPVSSHEVLGRVIFIARCGLQLSPRATFFERSVSMLFRRSDFLTKSLVWTLNRTRLLGNGTECRA